MQRMLLALLLVAAIGASACLPTVEAQSFPLNLIASWDPVTQDTDGSPIAIDHYTFTLDGAQPIEVRGQTQQAFAINAKGQHTVSITAVTALGEQSSPT